MKSLVVIGLFCGFLLNSEAQQTRKDSIASLKQLQGDFSMVSNKKEEFKKSLDEKIQRLDSVSNKKAKLINSLVDLQATKNRLASLEKRTTEESRQLKQTTELEKKQGQLSSTQMRN
jgi:hypothetical protein